MTITKELILTSDMIPAGDKLSDHVDRLVAQGWVLIRKTYRRDRQVAILHKDVDRLGRPQPGGAWDVKE